MRRSSEPPEICRLGLPRVELVLRPIHTIHQTMDLGKISSHRRSLPLAGNRRPVPMVEIDPGLPTELVRGLKATGRGKRQCRTESSEWIYALAAAGFRTDKASSKVVGMAGDKVD